MSLINLEHEASQKYLIEEDVYILDKKTVKLTADNVARVEAMIITNSVYKDVFDDSKEPIYKKNSKEFKYIGSSSYWLRQLKENTNLPYIDILRNIIIAVDIENSTHLNSDTVGREAVLNRISVIEKNDLMRLLKYPGEKYELIYRIQTPETNAEKTHFSFATKFCHYACLYLFKGEKEEDNFSIYDSVIEKALPLYIKRYLDKDVKIDDYKGKYPEFIKYVDAIIEKASKENDRKISRNGFDHLLWYYHKGR